MAEHRSWQNADGTWTHEWTYDTSLPTDIPILRSDDLGIPTQPAIDCDGAILIPCGKHDRVWFNGAWLPMPEPRYPLHRLGGWHW